MATGCPTEANAGPRNRASVWSRCGVAWWCSVCWGALCWFAPDTSRVVAHELERVTLVLQWQHQAQFAGYYMAAVRGCYRQAGLDVRILRGGPDVRVGELLRSGEADFGTLMLSTALGEVAQDTPLVHLTQVVNRSNFLLVAWRTTADGGRISELADLNGRRVTIWTEDFRAPFVALFRAQQVHPVILPQYNTFSLFLHRGADAFVAMRYNEYHTLLQSGISDQHVRVFALQDYGMGIPEDGLYTLADTWRRRPETCRAFARASLEGWRYARDHTEETLDVVMGYIDLEQLPTNRAHMRWMLREMIATVFPGPEDPWVAGRLQRDDYDKAVQILTRHGDLRGAPDFESFAVGEVADE